MGKFLHLLTSFNLIHGKTDHVLKNHRIKCVTLYCCDSIIYTCWKIINKSINHNKIAFVSKSQLSHGLFTELLNYNPEGDLIKDNPTTIKRRV